MIESGFNGEMYEVACDGCDEVEEFRGYTFMEVVKRIKELGWTTVKKGTEWEHYCPGCSE